MSRNQSVQQRLRRTAVATLALTALLVSCADDTEPQRLQLRCPADENGPTSVVIGARANSAVPTLPPPLVPIVDQTAEKGARLTLVRLDGSPEPVFDQRFQTGSESSAAKERDLVMFLGGFRKAFADTRAAAAEADVLSALSLAGRQTTPGGTVIMLDSGLQTVAPLDFRQSDLLLAEPADIVEYLRSQQLLPMLEGRRLIMLGLGEVAAPQAKLDQRLIDRVTAIWRAVGEAAGACVEDIQGLGGRESTSVTAVPPVGLVPLPAPVPPRGRCDEFVLDGRNNVGFTPGTTTFRNESDARAEIQKIVDLAVNDVQRVEVIGTTARQGTRAYQIDLANARAQKVADIMAERGIDRSRMTAVTGVGSFSDYYTEDGGPGTLNPGKAEQNRRVIVKLVCPDGNR